MMDVHHGKHIVIGVYPAEEARVLCRHGLDRAARAGQPLRLGLEPASG